MDTSLFISAFFAGLISFIMPCTFPLVPGFLAFIAGTAEDGIKSKSVLKVKMMRNALLFVLGFSSVFIMFGMAAGLIGRTLGEYRQILNKISGIVIVIFGLFMLDLIKIPKLTNNKSLFVPKFLEPGSSSSSFLLGLALGFGWTPCIGPILGSILLLASTSSSVLTGGLLLGTFALGQAIPFLILALLGASILPKLSDFNKILKYISRIGGVFLILLGIMQFTGRLGYLTNLIFSLPIQGFYQRMLDFL